MQFLRDFQDKLYFYSLASRSSISFSIFEGIDISLFIFFLYILFFLSPGYIIELNPFALAVLANKYVLASKNKDKQRLQFKIQLLQLLRKRNFSRKRIVAVFVFIKYLMLLPNELELEFENIISDTYQNHTNMREVILEPEIIALVNRCIVDAHGDTLENLLKKEREKAEQKIQQEREKVQQEREKTVMKLHHNLALQAKEIANIMSLEESIVLAILEKNKI